MELEARVQIGQKGRLVIPAEMRDALGIRAGDSVELRIEENELRISTRRAKIRKAQEHLRRYVPAGIRLSDELIAERREAARRE